LEKRALSESAGFLTVREKGQRRKVLQGAKLQLFVLVGRVHFSDWEEERKIGKRKAHTKTTLKCLGELR